MRRLACLALVLAACGDDGNRHIVDAPPQPDAPAIDAALPPPVTVTVTQDGAPVAGVVAYFQNADSTVVAEKMTDAAGTASAVMAAGGFVTLVNPFKAPAFATTDGLVTWQGVKPGDHLVARGGAALGVASTVIIPTDTQHGTVAFYEIGSSCGTTAEIVQPAAGVPPTLQTSMSFFGCTTTDLLVAAVDAAHDPLSSFFIPAQIVADQGSIDLSAQTYDAAVAKTYTYNNYTDTVGLDVIDRVSSTRGTVFSHVAAPATVANPAVATAHMPAPFTGQLDVVRARQQQNGITLRAMAEWGNTGYTTDYAAHVLPDFATAPAYDPATHTISWTTMGGAIQPDVVIGVIFAARAARSWTWEVVAPGGTSATLPVVPTDVFDFNIVATDTPTIYGTGTASVPGGYDAVRETFATLRGDPGDYATGAAGVISFNAYAMPLARTAPRSTVRLWSGPRR